MNRKPSDKERITKLIREFGLEAHSEGGMFAEVYTSEARGDDGRPMGASIWFFLEGNDISHFHRLDCEELWFYHEGCGMRITIVDQNGQITRCDLGTDIDAGQRPMIHIPSGVVFAAENLDPSDFTLVSCVTVPGFHYEGFALIGITELRQICGDGAEALSYLVCSGKP